MKVLTFRAKAKASALVSRADDQDVIDRMVDGLRRELVGQDARTAAFITGVIEGLTETTEGDEKP